MLRNREFRRFVVWFSCLSVLAILLGFLINVMAGILVSAFAIIAGMMFLVFTKARYKKIAKISEQIDVVLHNANHLYMEELEEGELSILHSEITKMMLRIREQNDALKKEKEHLANSLADIAHQLRTPLTSVNLILSLLANNSEEEEKKAFVREIEELLIQMDWLITSLLKLSRLDAGIVVFQKEEIDVNNLLRTALRPFLIPMELHQISVEIDVPSKMTVQADFSWFSQAIQNILKNCIESVGEDGKIEMRCEDNPLFTEITIRDSGTGFQKEDLPHIFDRFYHGNTANQTGYGIGLALCKMIITRQGGIITAKNHLQGGAIFNIRFPK